MEKRKIRTIFLFQFTLDRNAADTYQNIYDTIGAGITIGGTAKWWFKNFRSGGNRFEGCKRGGRSSNVEKDQLNTSANAN